MIKTDILISGITKDRLKDEFSVEKLAFKTVKGRKEPIEIYRVI